MTPCHDDPTPKWNGDYDCATRAPKPPARTILADVVGGTVVGEDGGPLPLGAIFSMVDLAAGRTSHSYMEGPVVTVSVDFGAVMQPIWHGELVEANATIAAVGSSSITVHVLLRKEILGDGAPRFVDCFTAQLTFVAIKKDTHRPYKNVPPLKGHDGSDVSKVAAEVEALKANIRETTALLKQIDAEPVGTLPTESDSVEMATMRDSRMSIDDSCVELRKQYLPRHENFGGNVFGGDLLVLLERAALYCAKRFCGAKYVSCIGVHGIHFVLPVQPTFLLRSVARVVHVGLYCMEIEVIVCIDRGHEGLPLQVSHVGYFSIIPHRGDGMACPVTVGLDLRFSTDEARRAFVKAKIRMERQTHKARDDAETLETFLCKETASQA